MSSLFALSDSSKILIAYLFFLKLKNKNKNKKNTSDLSIRIFFPTVDFTPATFASFFFKKKI